MSRPAPGSLIDVVDAADRPVGVVERRAALPRAVGFRTAHALVTTSVGELVLQRTSPSRGRHPDRWGSSAAGYVFAGETYEHAVKRCLRDELGVTASARFVDKVAMDDGGSRKFVAIFSVESDDAVVADPGHLSELRSFSVPELKATVDPSPQIFTPTFLLVFTVWSRLQPT